MLKYVKVETSELEVYEKVVVAYTDEQAIREFTKWNDNIDISDCEITIRTYELKQFIAPTNEFVDYWNVRMENTLYDVASIQLVKQEYDNGLEFFSKVCIMLEDNWSEYSVEERCIRYANIQDIYERLLRAIINE